MTRTGSALIAAVVLIAVPCLHGQTTPAAISQPTPAAISNDLGKLRSLSDQERPAATIKAAHEIAALPPGIEKVQLADRASQRVTEGDQGHAALQAVADALSMALSQTAIRTRGAEVPEPYMDLARLVRYEGVSVSLDDPLFRKALDTLAADEAAVSKADFTLTDIHNTKWTLSDLRGKIVLVNFWATWCPPCRSEMPILDAIYTHYRNEGLIILSITDESPLTVVPFLAGKEYHPPVLIDSNDAVHKQFHILGIPKTFVFDREGRLVGEAIDQSTQQQFLSLLARANLKPE